MSRSVSILGAMVLWSAAVVAAPEGPVTFSRDVAPVFFESCAGCHRPGEIAPMSLLTYESARPWAKSIARMVESRRMPPWGADPHVGEWANDMSLTEAEISTIVSWVEQGAAEGDAADLPAQPTFHDGWHLGEPDYVIELDPVEVYAEGEDLFPEQWIDLDDLPGTVWVRAIEFLPGDPRVTHHFLATYSTGKVASTGQGTEFETGAGRGGSGIFGVWTAGMQAYEFPDGMGRIIGPTTRVLANSHYHPAGEATVDRTKIGLYFGQGELRKEVSTQAVINTGLRIPPGDPDYEIHGFHEFDQDTRILAFSPHMHVRGKAMKYELVHADGHRETVLDVPLYNYNYQWLYYRVEPLTAPAGSRLEVTATWDNSGDNPANPDPEAEILYRADTFNEMFVGFFETYPVEGTYAEVPNAVAKIKRLLSDHPAEDSYVLAGMLPLGLYLPRDGEGWIYSVVGTTMTTISLDDIRWNGDQVEVHTTFPTADADGISTVVAARLDADGQLVGEVASGVLEEAAGERKALRLPFLAKRLDHLQAAPTASGGR